VQIDWLQTRREGSQPGLRTKESKALSGWRAQYPPKNSAVKTLSPHSKLAATAIKKLAASRAAPQPRCDHNLASAWSLVVPRALAAPAFEHVDDGARARVNHRSNQLQSFTTGTAGLVRRLAFQNGDFLSEE
jgi:hypothetical protein